ncbi:MAG: phage major capsid protein [Luteolibacter sp.]|uniref:phage major capsid protein n=1 Tax=Luteolibacter sp. TaxID=1962973 RepID=UPI0032674E5C
MNLKALKEKRGALMKESDLIIRGASAEKRAISNTEDIRLGSIKGEILEIDFKIAREEQELRNYSRQQQSGESLQVDASQYSITRAMRGASLGRLDGYEAEISAEIAHRSGKPADGFYVPHAALMERRSGMGVTVNSGANGGNTVATEIRGFIDALRPMLQVARAGATLMSGLTSDVGIPRHAAASTASWKSELADHDESSPALEQLLLQPRRCGAWTRYSKQLIAQSSPSIEAFVRNDLMQAIAVGFDSAAINGLGSSDQPRGILATSGIGAVVGGTNGLAPSFAHLAALVAAIANVNATGGNPGFLFSTKIESKLRTTVKVSGTDSKMILEEGQATLVGNPWYASNNAPDNLTKGSSSGVCSAIIFGNWADLILASFGEGVDVIVDPFTLATSSQTRVVVNSLCDVGVRRAASFAAMKDALSA